MFSAREKETCYFTLTRSLIKIIYKDLLISFTVSFCFFLEVLCLPCPSKRGFIWDSDKFHQGITSEVPLKISAWQWDELTVCSDNCTLAAGKGSKAQWGLGVSLLQRGERKEQPGDMRGNSREQWNRKHPIKSQRFVFYPPLGIYAYTIQQQSNVGLDIWEAALPVLLQVTSSNFREIRTLNGDHCVSYLMCTFT